jgi:hypothetical protein
MTDQYSKLGVIFFRRLDIQESDTNLRNQAKDTIFTFSRQWNRIQTLRSPANVLTWLMSTYTSYSTKIGDDNDALDHVVSLSTYRTDLRG